MPIREDSCPGPCTRAARKEHEAYDQAVIEHADAMQKWLALPGDDRGERPAAPQPPTTPVYLGDPVWDSRCARAIRAALSELDDTAALLAAGVDGHRGAAIAGPNGVAAPRHTSIIDTLDELFGALVEVEDLWREARGYSARPRRARGGHARTLTITWLLDQLDDILLHPGSVAFGLGVLAWQRRLRALTKSDPAARRSHIRCPRCREMQVARRDDGYFECACGRLLTQQEHDRERDEQADEHDRQEVGA